MRKQDEQYMLFNRPVYDYKSCDFSGPPIVFFDEPVGVKNKIGLERTWHDTNVEIACQMSGDFEVTSINVFHWLKGTGDSVLNTEIAAGDIIVEMLIGSWRPFQLPMRWFMERHGQPYSFEPHTLTIPRLLNYCVRLTPNEPGKSLMGFVMVTLDGAYKTPVA